MTSTFFLRGRRGPCGTGKAVVARLGPVVAVVAAALCVAGVALGDIDLHFVWQGIGKALVARLGPLVAVVATAVPVAGVALGDICDIDLHFVWQVWHLVACMAGVALGGLDLHFAWHAKHLAISTCTLCGRRGTWRHRPSLCMAGVALMALGTLWWRACVPLSPWSPQLFLWQAWHLVTSTFTLHGRHSTWWHRRALCVAGKALADSDLHFAWQAWRLRHWAGSGGALGGPLVARDAPALLRGRRGAW